MNKNLSYIKFTISLLITGILFIFLDSSNQIFQKTEVSGILFIVSCVLGGPYSQMSTVVPLRLSVDP